MNAVPLVTVILPIRNEADFIESSLVAVLAQDYPIDRTEVILIDGMSEDGTKKIIYQVADRCPKGSIQVLDNPGRIVSTGMNIGVKAARGEVIVRMDAHTEYAEDYIRQCVKILKEKNADNVGGPWKAKGSGYVSRAVSAAFSSPFAIGGGLAHRSKYEGQVDTVYLGCWPRKTFEIYGMFDEELVRNQDDEHNLRIVRGGGMIWQSPKIRSWYSPRGSLKELFKQYAQYGYWKVRVIQKHHLPASWRHIVPGAFLLSLCSLLLAGFIWPVAFWILGSVLGLYALCSMLFAVKLSLHSGWYILPILPIVFAYYHFGYGYGFIRGVLDFVIFRRKPKSKWTNLTRNLSKDRTIKP